METLRTLGEEAHRINDRNGWEVSTPQDWNNVPKLMTHMALVHLEVSEAVEAIRKTDTINFREELADIIIRVTSIAYGMGIDLELEVMEKLLKNRRLVTKN
jgi:NTP pyrophosphatase (non-canonical NTP hydrolase)